MRSVYGKMMHMLQDASSARMQDMTGVSLNSPMKTIGSVLKEGKCEDLLKDSRLDVATKPSSFEKHKSRAEIDKHIKAKMKARNELCEEFSNSSSLSKETILLCLESIDDARTNLLQNCRPVERMIEMLTSMFSPDKEEEGFSLAISSGRGGTFPQNKNILFTHNSHAKHNKHPHRRMFFTFTFQSVHLCLTNLGVVA